eukprot:g1575.t1
MSWKVSRGNIVSKDKKTGTLDEDVEGSEEITFNHVCGDCGFVICEHFYSFTYDAKHQDYMMDCVLCGRGVDRSLIDPCPDDRGQEARSAGASSSASASASASAAMAESAAGAAGAGGEDTLADGGEEETKGGDAPPQLAGGAAGPPAGLLTMAIKLPPAIAAAGSGAGAGAGGAGDDDDDDDDGWDD